MNRIYAYTMPMCREKGIYKVGGTRAFEALERVGQQDTTSCPEPLELVWASEDLESVWDDQVRGLLFNRGLVRQRIDNDRREWVRFPEGVAPLTDDLITKLLIECINELESKGGLKKYVPTATQVYATEQVLTGVYHQLDRGEGVRGVLDLCTRFGKTVWVLDLFTKLPSTILLLPAYWLSAHSSFEKEITEFRDFNHLVFIDTSQSDWQSKLEVAKYSGQKVVISLSLCGEASEERLEKFHPIRDLPQENVLLFCDEADVGAHTLRSAKILNYVFPETNKGIALFGSGTNVGRVAKASQRADLVVSVPYRLKEEKDKGTVIRRLANMEFTSVEGLGEFTDSNGFSWAKALSDVRKASAPLKAIFQGLYGCGEENTSFQLSELQDPDTGDRVNNEFTCVMHWLPQNKKSLRDLKELVEGWVPSSLVLVLSGDYTCNREAEQEVREVVAQAKLSKKRVIILSNTMGSRSFSIPEVEVCVFMFDRGEIGATEQKAGRCLTQGLKMDGTPKKVGWIVNLSFDSNRAETLTEMVLVEAHRMMAVSDVDFVSALKGVLLSINVFSEKYGVGAGLHQEKNLDLVVRQLRSSEKLLQIANQVANITELNYSELYTMLEGVPSAVFAGTAFEPLLESVRAKVILEEGSTITKEGSSELCKQIEDLQAKIAKLNEASLDLVHLCGNTGGTYVECLDKLDGAATTFFESSYGVTVPTVKAIIAMGVLPLNILDILVHNEKIYGFEDFWRTTQ